MANPEHVELVKRGTKAVNKWREDNPTIELDLTGIELKNLELSLSSLHPVNMNKTQLFDSDLSNAILHDTNFNSSRLRNVNLQHADLDHAVFSFALIKDVNMYGIGATKSVFNGAKLNAVILTKAWLFNSNLLGTEFKQCTLLFTMLLDSKVNSDTMFSNSSETSGCVINRYTIACLGEKRGGLTDGNLSAMDIHDDVAELSLAFSGIWGMVHFIAIFTFLIPYIWFLIEHGIEAHFTNQKENSITLFEAFLRYILSGGVDWRAGWNLNLISFGTFVFFLIYNSLRLSLLYKVKKLETKQEVSGVPVIFSFYSEPLWLVIFSITQKWGFIFYLICVCVNIYHFMQMRIPI